LVESLAQFPLQLGGALGRVPSKPERSEADRQPEQQGGVGLELRFDVVARQRLQHPADLGLRLVVRFDGRGYDDGSVARAAVERVQGVRVEGFRAPPEHLGRPCVEVGSCDLTQRSPELLHHQVGSPAQERLDQLVTLALERPRSGLTRVVLLVFDGFEAARALGFQLLLEFVHPLAPAPGELVAFLLDRFGFVVRSSQRVFCGSLRRSDPVRAFRHHPLDRAVQEHAQQHDQQREVDELCDEREPVEGHGVRLSSGHGAPERVGEDQDERDDEAVDRGRLDHRQAHEQGAGDVVGFVRLLGDALQRLRERSRLAERWAERADRHSRARRDDGDHADESEIVHEVPPSAPVGMRRSCSAVADAM
jgi:hypothetical protein